MASPFNTQFVVDASQLHNSTFLEAPMPEIEEGEVLIKVNCYALTTNNITYAVSAPKFHYFDFFPVDKPYGIIPVWGFGTVVVSKCEGIMPGERLYGYFPMADYLKIKVEKASPFGFSDVSDHRRALAPIYNYYSRVGADPSITDANHLYHPILKPLFATSFLNYHFLKDESFFEADQVVVTSASSKTALGLAYLLRKNKKEDGKHIIGLTSKKNVQFVEGTGYYDQVIDYGSVAAMLEGRSTVVIDMAGNGGLLATIAQKVGNKLQHICLIGLTDWQAEKTGAKIPQAKLFFAPAHAQQKYKVWGQAETNKRLGMGLMAFIEEAKKWMEIVEISTKESLQTLYLGMLQGEVDPQKGYIVNT